MSDINDVKIGNRFNDYFYAPESKKKYLNVKEGDKRSSLKSISNFINDHVIRNSNSFNATDLKVIRDSVEKVVTKIETNFQKRNVVFRKISSLWTTRVLKKAKAQIAALDWHITEKIQKENIEWLKANFNFASLKTDKEAFIKRPTYPPIFTYKSLENDKIYLQLVLPNSKPIELLSFENDKNLQNNLQSKTIKDAFNSKNLPSESEARKQLLSKKDGEIAFIRRESGFYILQKLSDDNFKEIELDSDKNLFEELSSKEKEIGGWKDLKNIEAKKARKAAKEKVLTGAVETRGTEKESRPEKKEKDSIHIRSLASTIEGLVKTGKLREGEESSAKETMEGLFSHFQPSLGETHEDVFIPLMQKISHHKIRKIMSRFDLPGTKSPEEIQAEKRLMINTLIEIGRVLAKTRPKPQNEIFQRETDETHAFALQGERVAILTQRVGKGSSKTVDKAETGEDQRKVGALITGSKTETESEMERIEFLQDGESPHPNIMSTYEMKINVLTAGPGKNEEGSFVLQKACDGTLEDRLKEGKLTGIKALKLMIDVVKGVSYMHNKGLMHSDIKPENLFVDYDGRGVVGDLGLACKITAGALHNGGTPMTMAPETATPIDGKYTNYKPDPKIDCFSLGVTLFMVALGQTKEDLCRLDSFGLISEKDRQKRIQTEVINIKSKGELSENDKIKIEMLNLSERLVMDPTKRIGSAEEIVRVLEAIPNRVAGKKVPVPEGIKIQKLTDYESAKKQLKNVGDHIFWREKDTDPIQFLQRLPRGEFRIKTVEADFTNDSLTSLESVKDRLEGEMEKQGLSHLIRLKPEQKDVTEIVSNALKKREAGDYLITEEPLTNQLTFYIKMPYGDYHAVKLKKNLNGKELLKTIEGLVNREGQINALKAYAKHRNMELEIQKKKNSLAVYVNGNVFEVEPEEDLFQKMAAQTEQDEVFQKIAAQSKGLGARF